MSPLLVMDKTAFWDSICVQVLLEGKGWEAASGHIIWPNDMFNPSRSCCPCLWLIHNPRALVGFVLRSRGLSDTPGKATRCLGDDDQQLSLNWLLVRRAEMGSAVSSGALGSEKVLRNVLCLLGWLRAKQSLSVTSSLLWIRPRMHHRGRDVCCDPFVYTTLLPSTVSFKDVTGCAARLWAYREGTI